MDVGPLIQRVLKAMFACNHGNTHVVEGKTFCPDCGAGVVFRWVVLRCSGCNQRRPGRYRFRQVVPHERCCIDCGEAGYTTQTLDNPGFYQLRLAMLEIETEETAEIDWWEKLNAWGIYLKYADTCWSSL